MAAFATAQTRYQYVVTQTVKPGMAQQYEEFIKKIVEAAEKNGGVQNWYTFQTTAGASGGQYGIVLPHDSWAAKDEWTNPVAVLTKAFGEDEAAKIMRSGGLAIATSESTTNTLIPDLSTQLDRNDGIRKFYEVSTSRVRSHLVDDYVYGVQKIRRAEAKAAGAPKRVTRRQRHGDRNVFTTATGYDSGAEMDKWPAFDDYMSAAYSENEIDALMEKVTAASASRTTIVVRYRPELSHPAAPSTTSN
jgi:hypothetical protein